MDQDQEESHPLLSVSQLDALRRLRSRRYSVWQFGSTTVNRLVKYGYAQRVPSSYGGTELEITELGRFRLATAADP